jgi:hypothetical protein
MTIKDYNAIRRTFFGLIRDKLPDEIYDILGDDISKEDIEMIVENLIIDIKDNMFKEDYVD